jgi:hypothetical protein
MDEHIIRDSSGKMTGLYVQDNTKEEGTESWDAIDLAIREYVTLHPMETRMLVIQNEQTRIDNNNKFGSSKQGSIRHGVSLPPALYIKLQRIMPDIFDTPRKLHHFMRTYGGFRTCNVI